MGVSATLGLSHTASELWREHPLFRVQWSAMGGPVTFVLFAYYQAG